MFDEDFNTEALAKIQPFIKIGMLPEVSGKSLTKEPACLNQATSQTPNVAVVFGVTTRNVKGMIACDNDSCSILVVSSNMLEVDT